MNSISDVIVRAMLVMIISILIVLLLSYSIPWQTAIGIWLMINYMAWRRDIIQK